jgi:tripartite-type tricarboxylate transporter receptor subunit TctC
MIRIISAVACCLIALPALAQFPDRPIRIIVPTAPGGSSDIVTRIIAEAATPFLGQRIVVESRPGGNGNVGMDLVAKSPPDGYTLGNCAIGTCTVNPFLYRMPYDIRTEIQPVFWATSLTNALAVNANLPVRNVQEFVALARTRPLFYGSSGIGSLHHMSAELLGPQLGVRFEHVAYRGAGPAMQDLIAGRVDFMIENISTVLGPAREGAIRPLAVTGPTRSEAAPDLPSFTQLGYRDMVVLAWFGFVGPANMPPAVVTTLNAAFNRALQTDLVQTRFREMSLVPEGGSPERFQQHINAELARWEQIVRERGIKAE